MLFSTTAVAFADSTCDEFSYNDIILNEDNSEIIENSNSWSSWSEKSRYNSNKIIEDLANSALYNLLTSGLSGIESGVANIISFIMDNKNKGDNVYYTTIVYCRTDGTGGYQLYTKRFVYSDSARKCLIGTIKTKVKTYRSSAKSITETE